MFRKYIRHVRDTFSHKISVFWLLFKFCCKFIYRGIVHDNSKLLPKESGFIRIRDKNIKFGSKEYDAILNTKLKDAVRHHYRMNSHHPEHYQNIISAMDLFDVIEMFFDWAVAAKRDKSNIYRSIMIAQERYSLNEDLVGILKNTALRLKMY